MNSHDPVVIERSAVATLLYFDIFNHPLTVDETFAFLPQNSISTDELRSALVGSAAIDQHEGDLLLLRGRPVSQIARRQEKQRYASTLWHRARLVARLIACFPFVRGLFVSGSLSKDATDHEADIDWFIVTEPGRLWICKMLLTLFRRTVLLNSRKYFCTNYYIASDRLEITDRNVFIATEIATARPLLNAGIAARFFSANHWITEFLPNVKAPTTSMIVETPIATIIRFVGELFFRGRWGDWLEKHCLAFNERFERQKHADVSDEEFARMFRCLPYESKNHPENVQHKIMEAYETRLASFGVDRRVR